MFRPIRVDHETRSHETDVRCVYVRVGDLIENKEVHVMLILT
jgi:hypothetical protein